MAEEWMTEDQLYCYQMLCDWLGGEHHVPDVKPCGMGVKLSVYGLSTFDGDALTRLVFLAHDRCVRVELCNGGPHRVGLKLHRRHTRVGGMWGRHPTIEEALNQHRARYQSIDDEPEGNV